MQAGAVTIHRLADMEGVGWPAASVFADLASDLLRAGAERYPACVVPQSGKLVLDFASYIIDMPGCLALIDCGKVDLSRLTKGPTPEADVSLDAVIPPPGVPDSDDSLIGRLVRDGHAHVPPGRRGVELTADVTCVGANGQPSEGLGAIGRPTEDWVIGNDTLNRSLHPHPDLWAQRVIGRAIAR